MPDLMVKNIPDDLYAQLERYAAMHRRSINSTDDALNGAKW